LIHTELILIPAAVPCDANGNYLPPHTPPLLFDENPGWAPNSWEPFNSRLEYDFANYHFVGLQSSAANINKALDLWATSMMEFGGDVPWANSTDLYSTIDAIQHGDAPWKSYQI
jgi:hypothetical protein